MTQGWTPQEGSWTAGEGTMKGSGPGVMRWILWSTPEAFGDCSISLKARKTAGAEVRMHRFLKTKWFRKKSGTIFYCRPLSEHSSFGPAGAVPPTLRTC